MQAESGLYRMLKRIFDIVFSVTILTLLSPILAMVAVLIKTTSPGPAVYSQDRVGQDGVIFRIYKFRTMVEKADILGTSVTTGIDPRITSVGRILRKTKVDELPQFWNVLKGDMSIVGPRPDVPEIIDTYTPEMREILSIKPGMTSIASLYLRREEDLLARATDPDLAYISVVVPEKIQLAMTHVHHQSIWYDLSVLVRTFFFVIFHRFSSESEVKFKSRLIAQIESLNNARDNVKGSL